MISAGYRKCDITPPLGTPCALGLDNEAEEVFDHIFARALVVGDGSTTAAILSLDLLGLNRREVVALRERIGPEIGVPPDNVIVHCTHTHQSPNVRIEFGELLAERELKSYDPGYWEDVVNAAVLAARRAGAAQVACQASYGEAPTSGIASNRRLRQMDGSVVMRASRDSEDKRRYPEGHIDPLARVASFKRLDGREILLQNLCCHPTASGGDEGPYVTADFPGHAIELIEGQVDRLDALHLTGPCGDINPGKYTGWRERKEDAAAMGEELGKAALAAREKAQQLRADRLELRRQEVQLPLRDDAPTEAELADRLEQEVRAYQAIKEKGERMPGGGPLRRTLCQLIARRSAPEGMLTTEVTALALGDLLLVFLPGECFLELGHVIRYHYADKRVIIAENCDYSPSYIPVPEAYVAGGYEPGVAVVGPEAFGILAKAACGLL